MTGTPELSPQFPEDTQSEQPAPVEIAEPVQPSTPPTAQAQQPVQVIDDATQQSSQVPSQSVQVPSSEDELKTQSKGSPTNALTWIATYWLRLIKKATHFGWQIVGKEVQK